MDKLIDLIQKFWPETVSAVGLGLIGIFRKKLIIFFATVIHMIKVRISKMLDMKVMCPVPGIMDALNKIQAELKPNGGSSLRDAVNKIERRTREMSVALSALQVSHEALAEVVDVSFFRTDSIGNTIYCSSALCRLAGITSHSEYVGSNWLTFVHPDDVACVKASWFEAINDKRIFIGNFRILNPYNGKVFELTEKATPFRDENGEVLGWEGVITQYKEVTA